jgi:hypothetical protein
MLKKIKTYSGDNGDETVRQGVVLYMFTGKQHARAPVTVTV